MRLWKSIDAVRSAGTLICVLLTVHASPAFADSRVFLIDEGTGQELFTSPAVTTVNRDNTELRMYTGGGDLVTAFGVLRCDDGEAYTHYLPLPPDRLARVDGNWVVPINNLDAGTILDTTCRKGIFAILSFTRNCL